MGKDKSQRTKGNVQPSSSGRAAKLVTQDGNVSFAGFDGLGAGGTIQLGYIPLAAGGTEDIDSPIDPQFRVVMRKLTKRDSVTKLKAVQEFTEMCKSSSLDAVEGVLPFWPRIYNRLAMDPDHRVREATQAAMEQLVLRVHRNLAPHLKSVIGVWLCAQYDNYAPVATAAAHSFHAAFNEEKRAEVVMFCRKELVEFLQQNLLTHTADSLSDPKLVSEEERLAKYHRTISSSLHTLGHVISVLTPELNLTLQEKYRSLFESKKLWKFAKHKSSHIRGALFALVATCCQKLPHIMISLETQVSSVVLGSLDDSDPAVCRHLWDAVLSVLQCIKECWSHVNIRKAVLPKLWMLLRSGGSGSASVIYPSLLPLISHIPDEITCSSVEFYKEFFNNLRDGLHQEKIQKSRKESEAVISAFMECLRFSLFYQGNSSCEEKTLKERQKLLVNEQLLPLLRFSLEGKSKSWSFSFYALLANILSSFTKSPTEPETDMTRRDEKENKKEIFNVFWQGCTSLCLECVLSQNSATLDSLAQFLICLKEPAQKRAQKVFFLEDELTEMNSNELKNDSNELKNMQNGEKPLSLSVTKSSKPYNGYFLNLVCNVCTVCLAEALEHGSLLHLQLLSKLTQPFLCDQLVKELLVKQNSLSPSKEQCHVASESFEELCICTVDSILLPMLNSSGSRAWGNGECILYVTDIVYDVIGQMSLENQLRSLNKFLEVNNRIILFCALVEKGCQKNLALMLTWLKQSLAKERVCLITQSLLVPDSTHLGLSTIIHSDAEREAAWKIVELCLLPKRELLLDDETTNIVLQLLLDFLHQFKEDHTREDDICRLLPRLQSFIKLFETKTKDVPSCLVNILYAAFELRLSQSISSEVSEALIKTWDVGLSLASCRSEECNPDSLEFGLISRAVNMVVTHLLTHDDIKGIEALSKVALQLTQRISENKVESRLHSVVMKTIFPAEGKFSMWRDSSSKVLWEVQPILERRLPKVTSINKGLGDFQTLMVPTEHVKMTLFVAYNIRNLINLDSKVDDLVRLALEILWLQRWCLCCADSELNHVSTNQTACKQIFESSNSYSLVHQCYLELDQSINIILEHLREQRFMDQLIEEALDRSKLHGNVWALVFSGVLHSLQAINTTIDSQLLLGNVLGMASEDEFTSQTLVSVVENLQSIYDLKLLHEQYSRLLGQGKDNAAVSMSMLVETACLRQWSLLTSGSEAALTEYQLTLVEVLDQIIDCKNSRQDLLLFTCSTSDLPMALVSFNCSLSQLMGLAVTFSAVNLKSHHWDFILCSLASWLQMCDENSRTLTDSVSGLLLCHAACSLHALVVSFFSTTAGKLAVAATDVPVDSVLNEADQTGRSDSTLVNVGASAPGLPPNLVAEWEEFFCGTICRAALNLFLDYSARLTTTDTTTVTLPMVRLAECLGRAVVLTPLSDLINYQRESSLLDIDKDNIAWSQGALCRFLPYLECHIHSLQLASYNILIRLMPKITYEEPRKVNSSELQEEDTRSPPGPLMNLAEKAAVHMMAILSDAGVPFGECLCMATDVEARDTCLTLMLAWKLILAFFRNTSQESRAEYAAFLRQTKAVENLLGIIFRLIPLAKERPIVKEDVAVNIGDIVDGESLHEICCSVFYDLLQWMPAMVRQWWNGLDKRRSAIVDKFTASVITPVLCQHEMQLVQSSTRRFDNMTVRARPSAREVAAIYTVDEISMELVVKLASNHPLGVVTVESGRKVGVTSGQWRSWMLQMTTFLTHQNGSIMDGLILWKHNVDKRFEGVDDCMICFSVIHASNYSLPKLTCKTCKKKFHSICLYRWFNTSNNSTCPLCRNLF